MDNIILEKSDVKQGNLSCLEHYAPIELSKALSHIKKLRQGRLNTICNILNITKAHTNLQYRKLVKEIAFKLVPEVNNIDVNSLNQNLIKKFDPNKSKQQQAKEKIAIYLAILDEEKPAIYSMITYHYEFFQACTAFKESEKYFENILFEFFEQNIQTTQAA